MLPLLFLLLLIGPSLGLRCWPCGSGPCRSNPACCPNGQYVPDTCGCCPVCAVDEGGDCGGPWRSDGRCARGLNCYRSCGCKAESGSKCVFPFKYEGTAYHTCTMDGSPNGRPWCALEVDDDGEVIPGRREDCRNCNDQADFCNLFNVKGICVSDSDRERIEHTFFGNDSLANPVFAFDDPPPISPAPVCTPDLGPHKCRCASPDTLGPDAWGNPPKPQCKAPFDEEPDPNRLFTYGWCFLEQVQKGPNHVDILKSCYNDVQYSQSHGRFYSYLACRDLKERQQLVTDDNHQEEDETNSS